MLRCMMRAKIHRATVTGADLHYEGSIAIDAALLKAADIAVGELVHVLNINTGDRIETYAIEAPAKSGKITLNGAAARCAQVGDKVIIIAYGYYDRDALESDYESRVVFVDDRNKAVSSKVKSPK